jgi:hypothetical protein
MHRFPCVAACLLVLLPLPVCAQRPVERLFYYTDTQPAWESLQQNIAQISLLAPGRYSVDEDGIIWGSVDARVLRLAREHDVPVMPLVVNPGFNQETLHRFLTNEAAREPAPCTVWWRCAVATATRASRSISRT